MTSNYGHCKELIAIRSGCRLHLEAVSHHELKIFRVHTGDRVVEASHDLLVQPVHVCSSKGRVEHDHLIEHAPERPNVTAVIIGPVLPHLGACVVRGPGLGVQESLLGNFRDIQVA